MIQNSIEDKHHITRLLSEKTGEVVAFACKECQRIVASNISHSSLEEAEKYALEHHNPSPCSVCGSPIRSNLGYLSPCIECSSRRMRENEQKRETENFAKAKKVHMSKWKGDCLSDGDDRFFFSLEEALEHYDNLGVERPDYLWECYPTGMNISADSILEHTLSEHHEDAGGDIPESEITRLQKYLDRWCKKQKVQSWWVDTKVAVLLDPADAENPS